MFLIAAIGGFLTTACLLSFAVVMLFNGGPYFVIVSLTCGLFVVILQQLVKWANQ